MKEKDSLEISTRAIAAKTSCAIWPKDGSDNLKMEMRFWEGGRIDRNHCKIGERRGSVIKYVMDYYTMVNRTHFHQQMSHFMNERMSEKVTGLKRSRGMDFQAYIHPAGQSLFQPISYINLNYLILNSRAEDKIYPV